MHSLVRHPVTQPGAIRAVEAELLRVPRGAIARFRAIGDMACLVVPPPAPAVRTGELWRTSCFELFVSDGGSRYREFNLSPSGAWAAYEFDDHRSGRRDAPAVIEIETSQDNNNLSLVAKIEAELPYPAPVGLTAVILETGAVTRYWATAFAPGEPDFHASAVRSLILDGVSAE